MIVNVMIVDLILADGGEVTMTRICIVSASEEVSHCRERNPIDKGPEVHVLPRAIT
jgi:hypothetical protein